jgi:hypothetical protein
LAQMIFGFMEIFFLERMETLNKSLYSSPKTVFKKSFLHLIKLYYKILY